MSSTMNNIRKEIAIMKKCRHMNLVRLVEVIDDPQAEKIYMGGYLNHRYFEFRD